MSYDIFLPEVDHSDTFHTFEYFEGLFQSASLFSWQVYLREVSRDYHFGVHTHTGEEHSDLLGGGVLRLVEDDYGVAQCASAHEGKWSYLYDMLFHHVLQFYGRYHVF